MPLFKNCKSSADPLCLEKFEEAKSYIDDNNIENLRSLLENDGKLLNYEHNGYIMFDQQHSNLLLYATNKLNFDAFNLLLKCGDDINKKNKIGLNPILELANRISWEAHLGNENDKEQRQAELKPKVEDFLKKIINLGADIHSEYLGRSALNELPYYHGVEIFQHLLTKKIDITKPDKLGSNSLLNAVKAQNIDLVKFILCNGGDKIINLIDKNKFSPLNVAIAKENVYLVKLLLEHGASTEALSPKETPLVNLAVSTGNIELSKIFLEREEDLTKIHRNNIPAKHPFKNIQNDFWNREGLWYTKAKKLKIKFPQKYIGSSIFHEALYTGNTDIINLVIDKLGLETIKNLLEYISPNGSSVLHLASNKCDTSIIKFLLENGADKFLNIQDIYGKLPLHNALLDRNIKIIDMLYQSSNLLTFDILGNTPLSLIIATENKNT